MLTRHVVNWLTFVSNRSSSSQGQIYIHFAGFKVRITSLKHAYTLEAHSGVCRGIPIFFIFVPKHRFWVLIRTDDRVPLQTILGMKFSPMAKHSLFPNSLGDKNIDIKRI